MQRRSFILSTAALAAGFSLSACRPNNRPELAVRFLDRSIPPRLLKEFRKQRNQAVQLKFESSDQLIALFDQLQQWKAQKTPPLPLWRRWLPKVNGAVDPPIKRADWLTLSDYWLTSAVRQKLIQPIEMTDSPPWQDFPKELRQLMRRNREGELDSTAPIYGAPYRIQSLMLVYHRSLESQGNWQPSLESLWLPEWQGRIALPEDPQLLLGLVLKVLGHSINQESAIADNQVAKKFKALHQQARVYDSSTYLKALINEDISLAVGWSGDILGALSRYPQLRAVFLPEGGILSCDLWVRPDGAEPFAPNSIGQDWIDFCWDLQIATQITLSSRGFSPLFLGQTTRPSALQTSQNLPSAKTLANSEFLKPLSVKGKAAYQLLLEGLDDGA
ncbi:MAG: extracellular solute-binding protein [Cyanobacteria bacterium P01_F01_bin.4]